MKILVFGASGKVGRLVVNEALRRGYAVTAFVHTSTIEPAEGLTIFKGDIYDRVSIEAAVTDQNVIVSALGSWGTEEGNVLSTAMQKIVPAAEGAGILRLVSLTGHIAYAPGDRDTVSREVARALFNAVAPKILRDGEDHIQILAASSLNWTAIRASIMRSGSDEGYTLHRTSPTLTISRKTVAHAMVDLAETNEWRKAAPFIRNR